ncbi:MAG: aspartate dehydrogenase [Actinobacteria bacterium]|nr:aspartate dehydrogenase [Actinomycetota bacterium]
MDIAIVGLGTIGQTVARAVLAGRVPGVRLAGAIEPHATAGAAEARAAGVPVAAELHDLGATALEVVLECANQAALRTVGPYALERGCDLIAVSVGATLDALFLARLIDTARTLGRHIWFPSGAIGGLDVLRAAATGDLTSVRLVTTKPPQALAGAPYVVERGMAVEQITTRTEIFSGDAQTAVRAFPQNVNVAALLGLACGRPELVSVTVVADPGSTQNRHEVYAEGEFGAMRLVLENAPSRTNPKTSAIAAQSVIALLRQIASPARFA